MDTGTGGERERDKDDGGRRTDSQDRETKRQEGQECLRAERNRDTQTDRHRDRQRPRLHRHPHSREQSGDPEASGRVSCRRPRVLAWPEPLTHCLLPTRTPAMIGCSFVVDREYFGDIGLLDPGMEVYGGENIELGMRVSGPLRSRVLGRPGLQGLSGAAVGELWGVCSSCVFWCVLFLGFYLFLF